MDNRDALLKAALEYAGYGWRVVPLRTWGKRNKSWGKAPYMDEWPKLATADATQIQQWWQERPQANVGVRLGETSNLIDFEGDHPKSEANLTELFDGNVPVTAVYQGARGKHWLFRWHDDLPGGAKFQVGHIEVRTGNDDKGAQSVFPPSVHVGGAVYKWLVPPKEVEIATLPDTVVAKLWNLRGETEIKADETNRRPPEHWQRILAGLPEGERATGATSYLGKLLRSVANLDDASTLQVVYESARELNLRCKPPRDEGELRTEFDSILRAEKRRRLSDEVDSVLGNGSAPVGKATAPKVIKGWKLVIVHSDPPRYELYADQFHAAENGCIVLTAEQFCSGPQIRVAALKQANYPLTKSFAANWDKRQKVGGTWQPSLYERLVLTAEHRDAPPEEKRYLVVAERLLSQLGKAHDLDDGKQPDCRGRPCRLPGGEIVFGFTYVWEQLGLGADKVARNELSKLLSAVGADWHVNQGHRWKRLSAESMDRLGRLLGGD